MLRSQKLCKHLRTLLKLAWAAWYNTWLLIKLTPKGVLFSFLFLRLEEILLSQHCHLKIVISTLSSRHCHLNVVISMLSSQRRHLNIVISMLSSQHCHFKNCPRCFLESYDHCRSQSSLHNFCAHLLCVFAGSVEGVQQRQGGEHDCEAGSARALDPSAH